MSRGDKKVGGYSTKFARIIVTNQPWRKQEDPVQGGFIVSRSMRRTLLWHTRKPLWWRLWAIAKTFIPRRIAR